jgi:hypothetical protein
MNFTGKRVAKVLFPGRKLSIKLRVAMHFLYAWLCVETPKNA